MPGEFDALLNDLNAYQADKGRMEKALVQTEITRREVAELRRKAAWAQTMKKAEALAARQAEDRPIVMTKASPPAFDFAQARATLAAAARSGEATPTEIARAESMINRLQGQAMQKALDATRSMAKAELVVPNSDEHNAEANRARQHPTQTDFAGVLAMARSVLSRNISAGKYGGVDATKAEGRNQPPRPRSAEIHSSDAPMEFRHAAIERAVDLLRDLCREGDMSELDVSGLESQLHAVGFSLGLGSATDVPDPMVA